MRTPALADKVAIVTGSSRGIGAAIAKRLAMDGAAVMVTYNSSSEGANEVAVAIEKAGGRAKVTKADVSAPGQVKALFDATEAAFGPVSLLVNNAGMRQKSTEPTDLDADLFYKLFATNVLGAVLCTAEFARRAGSRGGRIVNITSGQARAPGPGVALYAGTKGALESLTRGFAIDLGPASVTVNAVAPGPTESKHFKEEVPEKLKEKAVKSTPLGRLGQPEDIADVIAFLLSDQARWITGQVIDVNGGLTKG